MDIVIHAAVIYAVLFVVLRLPGRRQFAQMTPFDLVLLLIVAEAASQSVIGADDYSITRGVVLVVTLVAFEVGLSEFRQRWPKLEPVLEGTPSLLVSDGMMLRETMRRERVSESDILDAARLKQGLERLDQIRYAVLEPNGQISIVPQS